MKSAIKRLVAFSFVMMLVVSTVPLGAVGTAEATPASSDLFTVRQESGACYVVAPYTGLQPHVEWIVEGDEGHDYREFGPYKAAGWNGPDTIESVMDYRFQYTPEGGHPYGQTAEDAPFLDSAYRHEPWEDSTYGLYDWSANGESRMFLYDGPNGISLVMRHDRLYDTRTIGSHAPYRNITDPSPGGGAVSFRFTDLPNGGWAYLDDAQPNGWYSDSFSSGETTYHHQDSESGGTSYKTFAGGDFTADWAWYEGSTDGGAYRGLQNLGSGAMTIDPSFNENAALWQMGPQKDTHQPITAWRIRDAQTDEWQTLDMRSTLTIERGANCDSQQPSPPSISDFRMTIVDESAREVTVQFDSDVRLTDHEAVITDDSGNEVARLTDFAESGSFTYTASTTLDADGTYTATLVTASNAGGNGANGQQAQVTIQTQTTTEEPTTEEPTPEEPTPEEPTPEEPTTEEPTTEEPTTQPPQTPDDPDPSPPPSNPGGSASYGGAASPPSVIADVERTGANGVKIDVQNARDDENVDFSLPAESSTMGALRFTDVSIDLADDDAHFVLDASMSAEAPPNVSPVPGADATMGYMTVSKKYLEDDQLKGATVTFSVTKKGLKDANLAAEDVSLYRYGDGEWTKLNTSVAEEKKNRYVLEADSPTLSTLAVAGTKTVSVTDVSLSSSSIQTGEDAELSATIRNTGTAARNYTAELVLNGKVVDSKRVTVAPGESSEMAFTRTMAKAGNYRFSLGDVSADLVVEKQTTTAETTEATTGDGLETSIEGGETGSNGQPGFGPLTALIALAGAMLLAGRRR